ncbi:MAG: SDR family NAD(P)-dependent oxidoreductase [Acidimicrobiia bacterium]|nr:SDR family NAD(P)-dependent oxidoreductase [Acidimicrobiia bacterium]MYG57465.1 SDR family NAD(P)-dependent oxidoreductase [Acidimicrobiia bacterium]MYJ31342.1 SDR family NAD(P)-dependent oxidoreductase [Acidimicrobiia bacterium]
MDGSPLAGKVALVTGASRGIGKGCALELAAAGATVYVTGRTTGAGQHPLPGTVGATAEEIAAAGGSAVAVSCDHRDDGAVRAVFDRIAADHGRLDALVNNAFAIPDELTAMLPFWEVPISNWDDMMDVGTRSAYVASVLAAPVMIEQGDGLIANISSSGAVEYAWHVAYGVGKCALDRMTADCARELRDAGVSMVSVWPGFVRTERIDMAVESGVELPPSLDLSAAESPRFTGRAVTALAIDAERSRYTGRAVSARDMADAYGFTDVDGRLPAGPLHDRTG